VPTSYAGRTLETIQQTLQEEADALEKLSSSTDERQAKALEQVQNLEATIDEMQAAVEAGDHAGMARQVNQLAVEEQTIKALAESLGGQP
jgi:predicted nuclease with TOPRIM domain